MSQPFPEADPPSPPSLSPRAPVCGVLSLLVIILVTAAQAALILYAHQRWNVHQIDRLYDRIVRPHDLDQWFAAGQLIGVILGIAGMFRRERRWWVALAGLLLNLVALLWQDVLPRLFVTK